ncbi:MAG: hypothetical protein IPK80_06640 [Nannocystis sp.]|nr:hypothetical protein [Nannocystis sp.]
MCSRLELRVGLLVGLLVGLVGLGAVGCRGRGGALEAPAGAVAFEGRYNAAFDDGITTVPVRMVGRAPGDVLDQRLFGERLGYAHMVVLVEVEEVWERRRPGKAPERFVSVRLGEVLVHELPKKTLPAQTLVVRTGDPLPPDLRGQRLLMFVRWAPGQRPSYRHHLMVVDDEVVALVRAMVRHAQGAGQLGGRRQKSPRKKK